MAAFAILLASFIFYFVSGVVILKIARQKARDHDRKTYQLAFPADLDPDRVTAWIRSICGTLRVDPKKILIGGIPTVAIEVWATDSGIVHRIKIPWQYEPYIRPKLEALVPGIRLITEDDHPERVWVHALELGLKHSERRLNVFDPTDVSTSTLSAFGSLQPGETLMMQWVISPLMPQHKPVHNETVTSELQASKVITGRVMANKDEVDDRRRKLEEPNMVAVLRVGAVANTKVRAQHLVRGIVSSLEAVNGPATHFYRRFVSKTDLQARITRAGTPALTYPIQLSAPELTAVIGWPLNSPLIAGLPAAVSRYLPASTAIPTSGRVIGSSNFPGRERKIAMDYRHAVKHTHIFGPPGVGKTALMTNMASQDIANGYGVVLIESKGDLFNAVLDEIPPERIDDVIVMDVNDQRYPVGFNILKQGDPAVVIDELNMVFGQMFGNGQSVWLPEMMYHGLHTLAGIEGAAFTDLAALVSPNFEERVWRDNHIRAIKNPQLKNFWQRFDNQLPSRRDQIAQPVLSRVWPMSRSKLINIVGQSTSSFEMADVISKNKILLVNLSNLEKGTASLMGTLLINALWQAAKAHRPEKANFLYLDEAHHYMNLPVDLELMLVEARSMKLGLNLAHQHLHQLPPEMKGAIMHSVQNRIVFQAGFEDANEMARALGKEVTQHDVTHLGQYETIVRLATDKGVSSPITMSTLAPATPLGSTQAVLKASREKYGRPYVEVQDQILQRKSDAQNAKGRRRPSIGTEQAWS